MHLVTFDLDCDLILGLPFLQQVKIISGMFTDDNKHSGSLCRKSAHTSKYAPIKPPVYQYYDLPASLEASKA